MGDDQRRPVGRDVIQCFLDVALGFGVERRGGFVEDENRGVFQDGAGDRQTLSLPAGEQHAVLADQRVEAQWQSIDKLIGVGRFGSTFDFRAWCQSEVAVGDVGGNRVVEKNNLLRYQCDVAAQVA